jgi:hypothetical protein
VVRDLRGVNIATALRQRRQDGCRACMPSTTVGRWQPLVDRVADELMHESAGGRLREVEHADGLGFTQDLVDCAEVRLAEFSQGIQPKPSTQHRRRNQHLLAGGAAAGEPLGGDGLDRCRDCCAQRTAVRERRRLAW